MVLARLCVIGVSLALAAVPAHGQSADRFAGEGAVAADNDLTFGTQGRPERTILFSALFGVQASPPYFGSDEMQFGPSFRAGVGYLNFAGVSFGETELQADPYERDTGPGFGLSFRFIQGRDSSKYDEIDGLDDIDPTVEIGGVVGYAWPNFEAIADLRYGFGGSDAWFSELRANYVARPTDRLAVRFGPRVRFGSENYLDTYFGVSREESERSGLEAYDPDGGIVSAGLELVATYRMSERWWIEGGAQWLHYEGDAADSPIVRNGSGDYTQVRIGLRRVFTLRF